jgi:mono/diheme cytochrome c family protein
MRIVAICCFIAGTAVVPATAQEFGDVASGRALATQVCAECHAVRAEDRASPNPRAPRFEMVAATPGMTAAALNVFLHTSHRSMPNLLLTEDQASGVIAYILSLKK